MEIKKTTLLSALVCVAGVLAEIMFHDVLASTIPGVALSVVLAVTARVARSIRKNLNSGFMAF